MARKVVVPLELKDGYMARTIDDLKEHFDLEMVINHFISGKLQKWLEDRNYNDYTEVIRELDIYESGTIVKICDCFGINTETEIIKHSIDKIERKLRKTKIILDLSEKKDVVYQIDQVAINQDELNDLLDKKCPTIYLLGNDFSIDTEISNTTLIGIEETVLRVNSEEEIPFEKRNWRIVV